MIACEISALLDPLANATKAAALWGLYLSGVTKAFFEQLRQWTHTTGSCSPHTMLARWDRIAAARAPLEGRLQQRCCASGGKSNSSHRVRAAKRAGSMTRQTSVHPRASHGSNLSLCWRLDTASIKSAYELQVLDALEATWFLTAALRTSLQVTSTWQQPAGSARSGGCIQGRNLHALSASLS